MRISKRPHAVIKQTASRAGDIMNRTDSKAGTATIAKVVNTRCVPVVEKKLTLQVRKCSLATSKRSHTAALQQAPLCSKKGPH
jgi:hypothetical protein